MARRVVTWGLHCPRVASLVHSYDERYWNLYTYLRGRIYLHRCGTRKEGRSIEWVAAEHFYNNLWRVPMGDTWYGARSSEWVRTSENKA